RRLVGAEGLGLHRPVGGLVPSVTESRLDGERLGPRIALPAATAFGVPIDHRPRLEYFGHDTSPPSVSESTPEPPDDDGRPRRKNLGGQYTAGHKLLPVGGKARTGARKGQSICEICPRLANDSIVWAGSGA